MKRYHYFAYYAPAKSTTKSDVRGDFHRFRDPYVLLNLGEVLRSAGFEYGTVIANVPRDMQHAGRDHLAFERPALAESDLVVVPTRSPLSEGDPEITPNRAGVRRSFLGLEKDVFEALASVFSHLDRERAILAEDLVERAGPFGSIQFHQNTRNGHTGGCVLRFGDGTAPADAMGVGYIAMIPPLAAGTCRVLTAFGMGGFETLVLSYIIRERLSKLVSEMLASGRRRVAMVAFKIPKSVSFPFVAFDMDALSPEVVFDSI